MYQSRILKKGGVTHHIGEGSETGWSKGKRITAPYDSDPANKYTRKYIGKSLWSFFDDLVEYLSYAAAKSKVPACYKDAFDDYARYYGIIENKAEASEKLDSRQIQAAARSAWSASDAVDFKLDIVRLGNSVIIYTKDPHGKKDVDVKWDINFGDGEKITADQYNASRDKEPVKSVEMDTLGDLEEYFTGAFKDLQAKLSGKGEPKPESTDGPVTNDAAKSAVTSAYSESGAKLFTCDMDDDQRHSGIDVFPKTLDGALCGVSWRILPDAGVVARYADNVMNGTSEIVAELSFTTADDLKGLFKDEFASLNDTLQIGQDSGPQG